MNVAYYTTAGWSWHVQNFSVTQALQFDIVCSAHIHFEHKIAGYMTVVQISIISNMLITMIAMNKLKDYNIPAVSEAFLISASNFPSSYPTWIFCTGNFRHCNWLSLRRLVSWINHLPPACWSTFWKSIFKHQLGCRFDILDSISSFFCILTYAIIYVLIHHIIFGFIFTSLIIFIFLVLLY